MRSQRSSTSARSCAVKGLPGMCRESVAAATILPLAFKGTASTLYTGAWSRMGAYSERTCRKAATSTTGMITARPVCSTLPLTPSAGTRWPTKGFASLAAWWFGWWRAFRSISLPASVGTITVQLSPVSSAQTRANSSSMASLSRVALAKKCETSASMRSCRACWWAEASARSAASRASRSSKSRRAFSSASLRSVRSRVTRAKPMCRPSASWRRVKTMPAQKRVPSLRTRQPSSSQRPSLRARASAPSGTPAARSSSV